MDETRKSGRKRQVSKKYQIDPFEGLELDEEFTNRSDLAPDPDESDKDAAFEIDPSMEIAEDDVSIDGGLEGEDLDGSDAEGTLLDDGESAVGDFDSLDRATPAASDTPGRAPQKSKLQSRGLLHIAHRGAKEANRRLLFGPAAEDQAPAHQAQYRWRADLTLPSRKADKSGFGGFHRGFYHTDNDRKREMDEDWKWYDEQGGREDFAKKQSFAPVDPIDASSYLPPAQTCVRFLMGSYKEQKPINLESGTPMNLNDPWKLPNVPQDPKSLRHGWLFNMGDKVQALDWSPNQHGRRQYLAVSVVPLRGHNTNHPLYEAPKAPAYTPQPPYKSSIQIWEFQASGENSVDVSIVPKLRQVLCTEWGDIKSLYWCPVPRKEEQTDTNPDVVHLGLIAAVCGDGAIRVLDVSTSTRGDVPTEYIRCSTPVFESRPPRTIYTCVTWLSSTGLAAGCANGCVAIYNLPSSVRENNTNNPPPLFFSALQTSYILEITSCYPSRPQMLLTTSMSGHLTMTDLTDISSATGFSPASTILSARSRIGKPVLVWHDWSQMAFTIDDTSTLCAYPLRRFHGHMGMTRFKAPSMTIAVSPVHPSVMVGCVNGDCAANNPMHRVVNVKATMWNQMWFTHEFRPTTETEDAELGAVGTGYRDGDGDGDVEMETEIDTEETSNGSGQVGKNGKRRGLIRMLEGYKPEAVKLSNSDEAQMSGYTTVYELESSVTKVAWNPNLHVGGWVAAGMASGLLRVEDVAT